MKAQCFDKDLLLFVVVVVVMFISGLFRCHPGFVLQGCVPAVSSNSSLENHGDLMVTLTVFGALNFVLNSCSVLTGLSE